MKVTLKLMVCVLSTTVVVAIVSAGIAMRSDSSKFEENATMEAERIASIVEDELARALQTSGVEEVMRLLQRHQIYNYDLKLKWVWFDKTDDVRCRPNVSPEALPELVPRRAISIHVTDTTGDRLHTYFPLAMDDRMGGVEFTHSMDELEERRRRTLGQTAALIASTLLLGGLVMWVSGVFFVGRPLKLLTDKTCRVAEGDLTTPVIVKSNDEMGDLANSLNEMCTRLSESHDRITSENAEKLAAIEQLRHADRLRTVGRLASGIAHELGTPLNVVSGRAEMIATGNLSAAEIESNAKAIQQESRRMTELIRRLLDFARRPVPQKSMTDIHTLLSETVELLRSMARKQNVEIEIQPSGKPCEVEIDVMQMQQVFTNMIMNSIQSMPSGGVINVGLTQEGAWVRVAIEDQGVGITPEYLDQVFEPFFTTKEPGQGTGLGLSIAHRIVEEHGGRIDVASQSGIGTTFTIDLPCGAIS